MDDGTTLAKFSALACVQASLRPPHSPASVLTFMFGVDYANADAIAANLPTGRAVVEMRDLWFSVDPAYDELCGVFLDAIHAASRGALEGDAWNATVDGAMAQLILSDQLTRNVFRGSQRAYAYDDRSLELVRLLSASLLGDGERLLRGDVYPSYWVFMLTALMHSESLDDHHQLERVQAHADTHSPPILREWFEMMRSGGTAHTDVIKRFGRYPHRNAAKGRSNTAPEQAWLDDVENLPCWARSQLVTPQP